MKQKLLTAIFIGLLVHEHVSTAAQNIPGSMNTDSLKNQAAEIKKANRELAAKTHYQYFIIKADSNTYGYSIYANGYQYIYQTTIPAMPGKLGFADTSLARRCAELVIQKIKEGEMPPSLSEEELKRNYIIN